MIVYWNGAFLEEEQCSVSLTDRGFLFGDGVFTTLRVEEGRVCSWELHMQRLEKHCECLRLEKPRIHLSQALELIEKNQAQNGVWRLKILMTGGADATLGLPQGRRGNLLMQLRPYRRPKDPLRLLLVQGTPSSFLSSIKSLSYLERLFLRQQAMDQGYDDALCVLPCGTLLEASFSNVIWRDEEGWKTPSADLSLLQGTFLQEFQEQESVKEGRYVYKDLDFAKEVYLCNALSGLMPVKSVVSQRGRVKKFISP